MSSELVPRGPVAAYLDHRDQSRYQTELARIDRGTGLAAADIGSTVQLATIKVRGVTHVGLEGLEGAAMIADRFVSLAERNPVAIPGMERVANAAGMGIAEIIAKTAYDLSR